MIKSNELRIGNKLQKDNGEIFTILRLDNTQDVLVEEQRGLLTLGYNLFGIPITEDWLKRFGFKVRESSTCKEYYIGENHITKDWLFDLIWLEKPDLIGAANAPFYRNGRHTIFYVHQLQNLYFALTGEELKEI